MRHVPNLIVRKQHHPASLRHTMDGKVVAICLLEDRCQRTWSFRAGDLNTVLGSIRKTLVAARQSMEVAGRQPHTCKETPCCLHYCRSPFIHPIVDYLLTH